LKLCCQIKLAPLHNGPAAADVSVTLYNGNGASVTWGPKSLATSFVKGATTSGVTFYHAFISGIQNGAPDGVALDVGGAAVQFLSYEVRAAQVDPDWKPC
jgi:hypothetical protein